MPKTTIRARSAVSGKFVKAGYAKRYPHLTITDNMPKRCKKR